MLDTNMQQVINRCREKAPHVLAESIGLTHDPEHWLQIDGDMPFCGCFIGSLAYVFSLEANVSLRPQYNWGDNVTVGRLEPFSYVARKLSLGSYVIKEAGYWCDNQQADREAVRYAKKVLRDG